MYTEFFGAYFIYLFSVTYLFLLKRFLDFFLIGQKPDIRTYLQRQQSQRSKQNKAIIT